MISRLFSRRSTSPPSRAPAAPPPVASLFNGASYSYEEQKETQAFGPAPSRPQFPWQFRASTNAAKLAEVRKRRLDKAEEKRRKKQAAKAGTPPAGEEEEKQAPHPASIPPEDGTCLLDLLPREILLYILQDIGEETLAVDCPLVSHQFNDLAHDEHLWKHRFMADFGRQPPNFQPPSKYSNVKWHRQPATAKEEYYHKVWKWYENFGGSVNDRREVRFTETVQGWLGASPHANSRMALLGAIASFDHRRLRPVRTNDRSAPRI